MFEKKKINQISLQNQEGPNNSKINLEYYLIEGLYKDDELEKVHKTYGVEIIKKELFQDNLVNIEQEFAPHLSLDRNKVEDLLDDLTKNSVTPMSLLSVLDNIIGVTF